MREVICPVCGEGTAYEGYSYDGYYITYCPPCEINYRASGLLSLMLEENDYNMEAVMATLEKEGDHEMIDWIRSREQST